MTSGVYIRTKSHRERISKIHKGKHLSDDTKRKISESMTGEKHPLYGKRHSKETKIKMSESMKGENHPFYDKHFSDAHKKKLSLSHKGVPKSETHKTNISIGMIKHYKKMRGK